MKGHQRSLAKRGIKYSLQQICYNNPRDPRCIWGVGHAVPDRGGGGSGASRETASGKVDPIVNVVPEEKKGDTVVPPPAPGGKKPGPKPEPMRRQPKLEPRPGPQPERIPRPGPRPAPEPGPGPAPPEAPIPGEAPGRPLGSDPIARPGGEPELPRSPGEPAPAVPEAPRMAEAPRPPVGSDPMNRLRGGPEVPRARYTPASGEMRDIPQGTGSYTESQLAPMRPSAFEGEGGLLDASDHIWNKAIPNYRAYTRGIPTEGNFPKVTSSGELISPTRSSLHMAGGQDLPPPRIGRTFTPPDNGLTNMKGANWFGKRWGKGTAPEAEPGVQGLEAPTLGEAPKPGGTVGRMFEAGDETGILQRLRERTGLGTGPDVGETTRTGRTAPGAEAEVEDTTEMRDILRVGPGPGGDVVGAEVGGEVGAGVGAAEGGIGDVAAIADVGEVVTSAETAAQLAELVAFFA